MRRHRSRGRWFVAIAALAAFAAIPRAAPAGNADFSEGSPSAPRRLNVLFIVLDDLNDWIRTLDPRAPIRTPNLDRLAARGVLFARAYGPSPACNPSRTAVLTGLRPSTTGVYGNASDWRRALPNAVTLPASRSSPA